VILIAGCTQTVSSIGAQTGVGVTKLEDIQKNPESFLNKEVTVSGIIVSYSPMLDDFIKKSGIDFQITYSDNQGYHYEVFLKPFSEEYRTLSKGSSYRLKGIIKTFEICNCESRFRDTVGNCTQLEEAYSLKKSPYDPIEYYDNLSYVETGALYEPMKHLDWRPTDPFYSQKILSSDCKSNKELYYECIHYHRTPFEANPYEVIEKGSFIKEYRCNPDSVENFYYIEGAEPMVKIS
jgi:hypothetical protein